MLRHGSHSFTCRLHHACLYSPAAEHHRPLAGTHFTIPQRVQGCVNLGGWLNTEIKRHLRESNPDTVTHPSNNRTQRRLTLANRAFRCSAPAVWNSLPKTVVDSDSIAVFKSKLKTFLFSQAYSLSSSHSY